MDTQRTRPPKLQLDLDEEQARRLIRWLTVARSAGVAPADRDKIGTTIEWLRYRVSRYFGGEPGETGGNPP